MTPVRLAVIASFVLAVCIAFVQPGNQGGALSRLEGRLLDIRFSVRGQVKPPEDIVILAIDDLALEQAQAFPLPRDVIAEAILTANQSGANVVVLDLLLSGETEGDSALKDALAKTPNAVLAISLMDKAPAHVAPMIKQIEENSFAIIRNHFPAGPNGILGPQPKFSEFARLGHVNLRLDDDGTLRRFPVAVRHGEGNVLPAIAVVAARLHAGLEMSALSLTSGEAITLGDRHIPLDSSSMAVLNHLGPGGTIATIPISEAGKADLSGKLVFIGATAQGYRDAFVTPFDTALPGVEALATLAANILDQTTLRRDKATWVLSAILAIIGATVVAFAASRAALAVVMLECFAVWTASLAALQLGFLANLWLDAATVLGALSVGTLLGFAARWETNRARAVNLSRYQSPQLVEALASRTTPEFDGRMQRAAVLFVDLVDFTHRSAQIGPVETGKLLDWFHTLVNDTAHAWNGVVSYTAGDGAMVVFGLPNVGSDDAARALGCAKQLLAQIGEDTLIGVPSAGISVRIGAHAGDVYATILGDKGRSTPTITGDVVNVASRLQEQAKTQGAVLAMSDNVYQEAGQPDFPSLYHVGPIPLRGLNESLDVWLVAPNQTNQILETKIPQ